MSEFKLFKFRKINKDLLKGIVNGTVYCAKPEKLNDPFDCQVNILRAAENAIDELDGERRLNLEFFVKMLREWMAELQKQLQSVAICSFSLNPPEKHIVDNPLLWSHYADDHRGLCLNYVIPEEFLNDKNEIIGIAPVEYGENLLKEFFLDAFPTERNDVKQFMDKLVEKSLTIKNSHWEYESEIRIIHETEGPFELNKSHLKQVYFGLNISKSDIDLVVELIEKQNYSVEFYRMERCGSSDFGIKSIKYYKAN